MNIDAVLEFGFRLYHGTQSQSAPAPEYASDPTGIFLFIAGVAALGLLLFYFHKQNQQDE